MELTQEQIERRLSDIISHGMREGIAAATGIYPGVVRAYFNPDEERKSPHFTVLHIQAAIDELDPAAGELLWQTLSELREHSRPQNAVSLNVVPIEHRIGNVAKEVADVVVASCAGKPISEQLREISEARAALNDYEAAIKERLRRRVENVA